jgi:hypothetical protein
VSESKENISQSCRNPNGNGNFNSMDEVTQETSSLEFELNFCISQKFNRVKQDINCRAQNPRKTFDPLNNFMPFKKVIP